MLKIMLYVILWIQTRSYLKKLLLQFALSHCLFSIYFLYTLKKIDNKILEFYSKNAIFEIKEPIFNISSPLDLILEI